MVAQPQYGQEWTVDQYLEMERQSPIQHEFIDGRVYAMSGGTQRHSRISVAITRLLDEQLEGTTCQVFNAGMKVRLANEKDHVYPDVCVSCDDRDLADDDQAYIRYPRLVVEVLSDSTEVYDRGAKFDLYSGRDTFAEYVLVETKRQHIEVRSRGNDGIWNVAHYDAGAMVVLHSIDRTIPLTAFFHGVRF